MDFLVLPPEVNSARIYSGPGSSSLVAAANSWNSVATDLEQMAIEYRLAILNLLDSWRGPSSEEMLSAALPFITWLHTTAETARQTAQQASSAAQSYTEARNASVHPAMVTANRQNFLTLVSTNIFGQNSAAIAANETMYSQMWVQDVAAMLGYHAANSAALQQFSPAPAATSGTTLLEFIQQLIPGFTVGDPLGNLADFLVSPIGLATIGSGELIDGGISLLVGLLGFSMVTAATQENARAIANAGNVYGGRVIVPPMPPSPPITEPVKASTGTGQTLGRCRVPPSWAVPQQKPEPPTFEPLPHNETHDRPIGIPIIPAVPVTGGRATKKGRATDPDQYPIGLPIKMTPPRNPAGG